MDNRIGDIFMNRIELGEVLRQKRKLMGRTLSELANSTDISINYLSALERGGVLHPNMDKLRRVAEHYRLSPDDVINVFYPEKEFLDELDNLDREFKEALKLPFFNGEYKERMLKENIGKETKKFIIELATRFKKIIPSS